MITRHILHPDIRVMVGDEKWSRDNLIDGIDRAKSYLIHERGAQACQKVLMISVTWPSHLIWFIACAELGLEFVVCDSPTFIGSVSVREKLSLYGEIHHMIGDTRAPFFKKFPDMITTCIKQNAWKDYPIHETPMWATSDSILLHSTTSGTTNMPKVCSLTHGFFYDLMIRNADVLCLKEDDICLHTRSLHHGSVAGVYFLPSLYRCKNHRWSYDHDCIDTIQTYEVNRAIIFHGYLSDIPKKMFPSMRNENLTLYVLSAVPKDVVEHLTEKMQHTIVSIYGCTETSGPVMLSTATSSKWNPVLFDGPLDNFYKLTINDEGLLTIGMPDGTVITPGDKFALNGDKWELKGRENLYRVKGETIFLGLLATWIESQFGWRYQDQFDLVFDKVCEATYLRIDSDLIDSLESLNDKIVSHFGEAYRISNMITGSRISFYTGIKFDANEVRLRCRRNN